MYLLERNIIVVVVVVGFSLKIQALANYQRTAALRLIGGFSCLSISD